MLTHTSGIKSFTEMKKWDAEFLKKELKPKELIDIFKNEPIEFNPGDKFKYNNSGYFLLGYIIEIVSGMSYSEYLTESFFKPLGLTDTYYENPEIILINRVNGYQLKDNMIINAPYLNMSQPYAAGSLISTVDDLKKWYFSVMEGRVLKNETTERAFSRYKLNNGDKSPYGYGWFIDNIEQTDIIWHSGGINGFRANSIFIPENNVLVLVLSNNMNNPSIQIARKIAKIAIENDL